ARAKTGSLPNRSGMRARNRCGVVSATTRCVCMPTNMGPVYCETPDIASGFPIEPANTWSSVVIVLYGLAAWMLVARRAPNALTLYALCALLIVNGAGSVLWHGMRTRWALALDALPAVVFVLIAAFLWARRVAPLWQAAAVALALLATPFVVFMLNL